MSTHRHLVFTTQNAVRQKDAMRAVGRTTRALAGMVVSAVGPATRGMRCSSARIWRWDVSPERFVAEGVLEALASPDRRNVARGSSIPRRIVGA